MPRTGVQQALAQDNNIDLTRRNSGSLPIHPMNYEDKIFDSTTNNLLIETTGKDANTVNKQASEDGHHSDTDIYRGEPPLEPREVDLDERSVAHSSSGSSSSSSSSDSSLNVGRRLGALASVVETAISRWARAHSSASSTTSSPSTTSSVSSNNRTVTTRRRRGRRYSSTASVHNAVHERAILARKRAQEEFRVAPREFQLLLPSEFAPGQSRQAGASYKTTEEQARERRIFRTLLLPDILTRLDSALKKSAKARRHLERAAASEASSLSSSAKGKGKSVLQHVFDKAGSSSSLSSKTTGRLLKHEKSWWLDVASPTWDDLRSIGKVKKLLILLG